uniref:RNase H type-1 domain-containing protein n=1 Tax=Quercus lobata TaxID=97700 RepID=A0A7N2RE64_QUELO
MEDVGLMVTTAWGIWTNRNEVRHGKSRKPASVLVGWTKELLENFVMANHSTRPFKDPVEAIWQPPKPSWYKANTNGAVYTQQKETGIGVVIRDHHGEVVAALSKRIKAPLGAVEVEAKAMEEGVRFAWEMGIRDCLFESDSLTVVNAMQRRIEPPSSIINVINGSLSQLYRFREVNFSHVGRSGNKAAHTLAQFAKSVPDQHAWVEEILDCIEGLVAQDVM